MTNTICARCSRETKGCCYGGTRSTESAFGISISDVERISKATGKKPSEFITVEKVTDEIRKSSAIGVPDLDRVMKGNMRLRLSTRKDGFCKLLGPMGCTLTSEDRPRICTLFPNHYERVGKSLVVTSEALAGPDACFALDEAGGSGTKLYRLLGTTRKSVETFASRAEREAREHAALGVSGVRSKLKTLECA